MKIKPADPDALPVVVPIVIEFPEMEPKRKHVRFDCREARAAVSAFYITKDAWGELGQPEGVRLTIEPL